MALRAVCAAAAQRVNTAQSQPDTHAIAAAVIVKTAIDVDAPPFAAKIGI
jgi:hypothetical protein